MSQQFEVKSGTIDSLTRLRRLMFTVYENLDILRDMLTKYFEMEECPFRYVKFQFESYEDEMGKFHKHAQGMILMKKQTRVGHYVRKKSGIKKLFKSDKLHVDYMNGMLEEARDYCGKTYNQCKIHHDSKHTPCKCNLFNLNDFSECKYCDVECYS
jgi:hypothetical protein